MANHCALAHQQICTEIVTTALASDAAAQFNRYLISGCGRLEEPIQLR